MIKKSTNFLEHRVLLISVWMCGGGHGGVGGTEIEGKQRKIAVVLSDSSTIVEQNAN